MNNEAILAILTSLRDDARNSASAAFGLMELHRESAAENTWRACLEFSRNSADRLCRSVEDARALFIESPGDTMLAEEFDLSRCLRETIEVLNLASRERTVRIRYDNGVGSVSLRQDRQALEQIFTRVLDGGARLTKTGEVTVSARAGTDEVSVEITPAEPGVAARLANWLRADPAQIVFHDPAGVTLGVGLMVAARRLQELGGTVEFSSAPEPARLVINLRSVANQISNGQVIVHSRGLADGNPEPDTLNILLAEDCDDSFALATLQLRNENVWRARNGIEAVEMVKTRRYDVVFMDVHMPGMDGYTAIRTIREWETVNGCPRTKIVILSSDDLETQRKFAAQSGCSGFLRKPVRHGYMLDLLDQIRASRPSPDAMPTLSTS